MLTSDFYPKPVYAAFTAMAREYSGLKFEKQLELPKGQLAFQLRGQFPKRIVLGGWNESGNISSTPFLIKTDAKQAVAVDLMGNRSSVPVSNGITTFTLAHTPSSLILPYASRCEIGKPLVEVLSGGAAIPGQRKEIMVRLRNPMNKEIVYMVKLAIPQSITADRNHFTVKVPPEEASEIKLNTTLCRTLSKESEPPFIVMFFAATDTLLKGTVQIPLNPAILIPKTPLENRDPDFVLDSQEHVFSRYQADPSNIHRQWQGPQDLSCKVWLQRSGNDLRLHIQVTDDKHVQPYNGDSVFNGDNVQMAIQLRQNGYWEIGLSHLNDGTSEVFVWQTPASFDARKVAKQIKLTTFRQGNITKYDVLIPSAAIGINDKDFKDGILFNTVVNDNDGYGRKGWIFLAPGLAQTKDSSKFPTLFFE